MADLQTVLSNLTSHSQYLNQFPRELHSARFEHLITEAISHVLRLPFYTGDNDDSSVANRVVWNGNVADWSRAPGGSDAIAYAHEFCMLIEATLKSGTKQWSQEFGPVVDHYAIFVDQTGCQRDDCYIIMVVTELHSHTYMALTQKARERCQFITLTLSQLAMILDTVSLAFTTKHLDIRQLLNKIRDCCAQSDNIKEFSMSANAAITDWQRKVLTHEKRTFLGVKSYQVMHRIGRQAATSEIYSQLYADSTVERYYRTLGGELAPSDVERSLEQESLGHRAGQIPTGENLYVPVPLLDVRGRIRILIKELEDAVAAR